MFSIRNSQRLVEMVHLRGLACFHRLYYVDVLDELVAYMRVYQVSRVLQTRKLAYGLFQRVLGGLRLEQVYLLYEEED